MLTINLEKKLLKQNKKILLPEELLAIKEYERLGDDFCESEVLNRIGINTIVKRGKSQKRKLDEISNKLAHFDQERVFHQSQIKSLCDKYYLRFLNVEYFKGSVETNDIFYKLGCFGSFNYSFISIYHRFIRSKRRPVSYNSFSGDNCFGVMASVSVFIIWWRFG
jgi:hypothetical protein